MLHSLKKKIIHEALLSLWDNHYLTFDDTLDLIESLKGLNCCQVNHWLKAIQHVFIEEYPATSKMYRLI